MGNMVLPVAVQHYVRRFVAHRRVLRLVRAGGMSLAVFLMGFVISSLLDRWLSLPAGVRLALLLGNALAFVLILLQPLRRVLHSRVDWLQAAGEIEKTQPQFGQGLATAVSQLLDRPEYRGSEQMLGRVVEHVEETIRRSRPSGRIGFWPLLGPWVSAAVALGVMLVLNRSPRLGFPALTTRYFQPLSATPAVTTTRLRVEPGNISLVRGQSLNVHAWLKNLTRGGVEIATSTDGRVFSSSTMLPVAPDHYVFRLADLDRNLVYFVRAGDATSPTFSAHILQPPAVLNYTVRCEYPAYTGRAAATTTSNDANIEILTGSTLTLTVQSSEPLQSATAIFGGTRIPLALEADPHRATLPISVKATTAADLELVSSAALSTRLSSAIVIRATPDRPPLSRMFAPSEDLRLSPRAVVPVSYLGVDDYGVTSLSLGYRVNDQPRREIALPRGGDTRRVEGQYNLDLSALDVKVGNVVTLWITATDGAGRSVDSEPRRHILIAPNPIDALTRMRVGELRSAAGLAAALARELHRAGENLALLGHGAEGEADQYTQQLDLVRSLATASESAILLHQLLLRSVSHAPTPQHTLACADLVDRMRQLIAAIDRLSKLDLLALYDPASGPQFQAGVEQATQISALLRTLAEGEQAGVIASDRANLRATKTAGSLEIEQTLLAARKEVDRAVSQLGLLPSAADLDARLKACIDAADALIRAAKFVRFDEPARQWALAAASGQTPPPLSERLLSASAVEAVRPDTSPQNARDLQLAARAAMQLSAQAAREGASQPVRDSISQLPQLIVTLQREHRLVRGLRAAGAAEAAQIRERAADARKTLEAMTNRSLEALEQQKNPDQDDLALVASAEIASRNYAAARRLSQRLRQVAAAENRANAPGDDDLARVQELDDAAALQDDLARRSANPANAFEAAEILRRQKQIAQDVGRIEAEDVRQIDTNLSPDVRRRATAAMQVAQEKLASMPQDLLKVMAAAENRRHFADQAERATKAAAETTDPAAQVVAERSRQKADVDLREADEELALAALPVSEEALVEIADKIAAFEPESAAVMAVFDQLRPALRALLPAARQNDAAAIEHAADRVRLAIELAQNALRQAQGKLIEQDPLFAARYFADAASAALDQGSADPTRLRAYQQSASIALSQAWQDAARSAMMHRLAMAPSLRPILTTQPADPSRVSADMLPLLKQWSFLRDPDTASGSAPLSEPDPAGYAEPLRLYFQAINQVAAPDTGARQNGRK
ncbi:MAG: hypothetical protein ACHRHE_02190 [Tepidisphaerales bacterium]